MNAVSRENRKQMKGLKRLKSSLGFAYEGIKYSFKDEQSIKIHFLVSILVIIASIIFRISIIEWIIVIFCIGLMLAFELINTSIEAVVDLITEEKKPLAKVAKDVIAGASVVFALTSVIIGIIIFLPKLIFVLKGLL